MEKKPRKRPEASKKSGASASKDQNIKTEPAYEGKELLAWREKYYKSILESTGIGLLIVDTSGSIIQMNNKFIRMWGIPEEIAQGKDDHMTWEFLLEKVTEPHLFRERIVDLLHSKEISKDVISLCDGRVFERSSYPQIIDDEIAGRSWGFHDITNRIRIEEALKESERNFRSLAEFSPIMIFINIKGRVVYVNQLCVALMEYSREEFYSEDFYFLSITSPEYRELVKEKFREHMQGIETKPYEYAVITKSGKKLHTVLSTKLINFSGERAILGMITDITEVKTAQMEIERINSELSKINSTKDKFFSIIAHDLKTPFNTIFWFSQSLIQDIPNMNIEELQSKAELIRDSSKQAYLLVENLLLWAQTQDRTIPFNPENLEISAIIQENIEIFSHQIKEKNIRLIYNSHKTITVHADIHMIRTVIRNLLSNAIRYTSQDGLIEIMVTTEKDEMKFCIRDNGIGIEKEKLHSIFSVETKRSISSSDQYKGSGLGLILCKEFIERHGGKIDAESNPGEGSRFTFTLPGKQFSEGY